MEREDELPGRQAAAHFRRREERRELDPDRLPSGAQEIDQQPPSGRHLGKRLPVLGLSRRTGAMGMTSLGHVASPSGCREQRGGEAGAQSGVLGDNPGELRMAFEKPGPAGDGGRVQSGWVGAEQPFDPESAPPHRLRIEPTGTDGCFAGSQGRVTAASCGDQHPRLMGFLPRGRHGRKCRQRVDDQLPHRRVTEQSRKEDVGLTVGDRRRSGHHHLDELPGLEKSRRPGAGDGQCPLHVGIAGGGIPGTIGHQGRSMRGDGARSPLTGITTEEPGVDVAEPAPSPLEIAGGRQRLRLVGKERRVEHRQAGARPLAAPLDGRGNSRRAGGLVRGKRHAESLLERPEITELRRGVGRLLKPPRRADRIVTGERDSPQDEQAPRRQRMIELAPERHAALEQRHRLIEPALRPGRGPEGHINP